MERGGPHEGGNATVKRATAEKALFPVLATPAESHWRTGQPEESPQQNAAHVALGLLAHIIDYIYIPLSRSRRLSNMANCRVESLNMGSFLVLSCYRLCLVLLIPAVLISGESLHVLNVALQQGLWAAPYSLIRNHVIMLFTSFCLI